MHVFGNMKLSSAFGLATILLTGQMAFAANYPLEITNIKPAGTGGMSANARIYHAYPGLVYNIRAAVVGGAYPYTYSLTGAPGGMTINAQTGEINWPSPSGTATPTLVIVDSEGTRVTSTWTITAATTRFKFVDAASGRPSSSNGCSSSCGTGAVDSPWRSLGDVYHSPSSVGSIIYVKAGTYRITDLPRDDENGAWERVDFNVSETSCQWLAYPGQRPRIDFGFVPGGQAAPFIRLSGSPAYIDGFETINSHVMAFQSGSSVPGPTFRKNLFHHHNAGGGDLNGTNAAFIMTIRGDSSYTVIQDNEFFDSTDDAIKVYMQRKLLVENNIFRDQYKGIEIKDSIEQFTLRGNTFSNISLMAIGGNMAADSYRTTGEILFNNVNSPLALDLNQNALAGAIYVYRNTFVGRVQVRNTSTSNGPYRFQNNVLVSSDAGTPNGSHIYHVEGSAPQQVIIVNNLVGYPNNNVVDASGALTAAYASYRPTHGHGTISPTPGGGGGSGTPPTAPSNVRIVTGN